ncbi:MAG: hypothetical protein ACTSP4_09895 [Candidatus Hodarchaeales archaeon]
MYINYPLIILLAGDIISILGLLFSVIVASGTGFDTAKIDGLFANIIAFGTMVVIFSSGSLLVHHGVISRKID